MRSPIARFVLLVTLVAVGLTVVYQLGIIDWMRDGSLQGQVLSLRDYWWTPLAMFGFFVLVGCIPLPTTAIVLTAGAVYGPVQGWAMNLAGCLVGAIAGYAVARSLGHDFVVKILGPERWKKLDGLMTTHGFWTMVRARWMVPLAVVNYGAGLAGMPPLRYVSSTFLGLLIPTGLYTYLGHLLLTATGEDAARAVRNALILIVAIILISLIRPALRLWLSRRRADG